MKYLLFCLNLVVAILNLIVALETFSILFGISSIFFFTATTLWLRIIIKDKNA